MNLLQSVTLVLGIIGSISGLLGLYISLSNFFNKRPKVVEAFREIGKGHDQNLFIKIICIDKTRIDNILLKDTTIGKKYKIYPESEKSIVFFDTGQHLLSIKVQPEFIEGHRYKLLIKTNYDRMLINNKFITRIIFLKTTISIKSSFKANLS
jgi:hypothetical protein